MSFEDTKCPCGGKKEPQTMLCAECRAAFADHPEMTVFQDMKYSKNVRRGAAIKLLKLAHRRRNPLLEVDEYISRREGKFSYDNE